MTRTPGSEHTARYQSAPSVWTSVRAPTMERSTRVLGSEPGNWGSRSPQVAGSRAACSAAEKAGRLAKNSFSAEKAGRLAKNSSSAETGGASATLRAMARIGGKDLSRQADFAG